MRTVFRSRLIPLALVALGGMSSAHFAGGTEQESVIPSNARPGSLRALFEAADHERNAPAMNSARVVLLPPEAGDPEPVPPPDEWPAFEIRLAQKEPAFAGETQVARTLPGWRRPTPLEWARGGLVLFIAVTAAGGMWLMLISFRNRGARPSAMAVETATLEHDIDLLQPLIANRLRIVEETLVLPPLACLHGRPVPCLRYRVDAAEAPGDPHFAPLPAELPLEMETSSWFSEPEPGVHQPAYLRRVASGPVRSPMAAEGEL
jgi:hypothetical protein